MKPLSGQVVLRLFTITADPFVARQICGVLHDLEILRDSHLAEGHLSVHDLLLEVCLTMYRFLQVLALADRLQLSPILETDLRHM